MPVRTLFRADDVLNALLDAMAAEWPVTLRTTGRPDVLTVLDGFCRNGDPQVAAPGGIGARLLRGSTVEVSARGPGGTLEFITTVTGRETDGRMTLARPSTVRMQDSRRRSADLIGHNGRAVFDVQGKDGFVRLAVLDLTREGMSLHLPEGVVTLVRGCRLSGTLRVRGAGACRMHVEVRHKRPFDGQEAVGAQFKGLEPAQRRFLEDLALRMAA